ncbi:MAG: tRNA (adenosine(37)-N6)-threonylcarbamoyltransferase complex ATPase subunit type 1 TsaE [Candidatus Levybacteria bacterium]|nr:tRNA (adenosine(37)-N6)-threonylcarbamoyltransferase complex ATPase subunit type 1 TsaE [Candidatus Levybacteria bacterium]
MNKKDYINKVFITNSSNETKKIGRDFAKSLEAGDVVTLYGDLGSGKTTFAQGLAEGLGIKKRIVSPTFVIVRTYEIQNSKFKSLEQGMFYHIDLYRTESEKDIEGLGLEEILRDSENIVVIEWVEKMGKNLPKKRIDIKFFYEKESVRRIVFRSLNQ